MAIWQVLYFKKVALSIYRRVRAKVELFLIPGLLSIKVCVLFLFRRTGRKHGLPAPLIVSLTSYPERFPSLHLTLKCLLMQKVAPDAVVLWIACVDKEKLPQRVKKLRSSGLVIRFCEDLRSFKKIIPSLKNYKNSYIVTADDDVYYGPSWLGDLVSASAENPSHVICHRSHTIKIDSNNYPLPYNQWVYDSPILDASPLTFQTGVGGVLYPPNVFHSDVVNVELFQELCYDADDIWLYWMMRMNNSMAKRIGVFKEYSWPGTQTVALWRNNVFNSDNDKKIYNMLRRYGNKIFTSYK